MSLARVSKLSCFGLLLSSILLGSGECWAQQGERSVWWEGESSTDTNFPKSSWFSALTFKDKADRLSGRRWLSNHQQRDDQPLYARYQVKVPKTGRYRFWTRKFWKHGAFRWRFDKQAWKTCGRDCVLEDSVELRKFVCVNWVYLGSLRLSKGSHKFELQLTAKKGEKATACFDAFFLTHDDNLVPQGGVRPKEDRGEPGAADWFPVTFYEDEFSKKSLIDLSDMVPAPAGRRGFLKMTAGHLKFEKDKQPVKLWGCGANFIEGSEDEWQQRARYLRKHGVRIVRQHPLQGTLGLLDKNGELNKQRLERWDKWFKVLKDHGIYMCWSLFYPHHIQKSENYPDYDELPQAVGGLPRDRCRSTSGFVNIEPALQDSEWRWAKAILLHKNPYTKKRYIDDPALAVIEVHNEDCVFWHSPLNHLAGGKAPKHTARLKQRWAEWLRRRYGSEAKLKKSWGRGMRSGDSLSNNSMGIYGAWEMQSEGPKGREHEAQRLGDFIQFLAELQKNYYERRMRRLRKLGYKAVTITTAWRAGGPAADPANLWADSAADMISRHNYFGGGAGNHQIEKGAVNLDSHLNKPGRGLFSVGFYRLADRAFCMTEWTQKAPSPWKFESAPIFAFYGMGLQDWDASFHFLNSRRSLGNGWPGRSSYSTDTPHYIGQFPALARAIYEQHIKPGPVVMDRQVAVKDLFRGRDAFQMDLTGGGHDDKRLVSGKTAPELFALGRLQVSFVKGRSKNKGKKPSSRDWDRKNKIARALTGELEWHYGQSRILVTAPKTQAVIGRAAGETLSLPDFKVTLKTESVSLIFTSLDQRTLKDSKSILVTALARDRQRGAKFAKGGAELVRLGSMPLELEPVQAEIVSRTGAVTRVEVLDPYGVPTGAMVPVKASKSFVIDGRFRSYYYHIRR